MHNWCLVAPCCCQFVALSLRGWWVLVLLRCRTKSSTHPPLSAPLRCTYGASARMPPFYLSTYYGGIFSYSQRTAKVLKKKKKNLISVFIITFVPYFSLTAND